MFGVIPPTWSGFGIFHDNVAKITELDVFDNWLEYGCLEETQFNFAHIYFPHVPYYKSPLGKDLVNTGNDNWKLWSMITTGDALSPNISAVNAYQHLHLQQVGYVDAMINKLVSRLKESDLFDKSLIIITTDHGVNLNPIGVGRRAIKNNTSWANIISIPLFVKYPFQKSGETNHSFVTSLDIADTILDIVGISTPWTSVGQSLHNFPPNSQTQSVSGIPGYEEYFHDIDNQFLDSVKRKRLLFGEPQPTSSVAVNYTENLNYDSLLNTDITSLTIKNKSNFVAVMTGELKPQSGAYYGTLFSAGKPINNQIVVVTVGGKIKAIQKSGIITEKQGKGKQGKEKHGFFLFSLPETKEDQSDLSVELYQIEGLREFTLRRIQVVDQATDLSRKFKTAKGIKFDWRNSIKGTHDIEITEKNKDGILVKSTGNDPFIMFSQIKSSPIPKPIFHLKLESNTDFSLQIFYQTISQPKFSGVNLLNHKVRKGENDIYISSPVDDFNGRFRIDIGSKSDTKKVLLKVVEIKSLSVSG